MNKVSYSTRSALLFALLGAGTILVACGDGAGLIFPPDAGSGGGGTTSSAAVTASASASTGEGSSTGTGTTSSSSGTGGAMPAMLSWVAEFDPAKFELPEGLAINAAGDTAYVGYAPTGQIVKVNLADGKVTPFGNVPPPPPMNKGLVAGITLDKAGDVYVAVASFVATYQGGIYKIPAAGGAATLFAKDAGMSFPNGLVFDATGNLFVTNSGTGAIFKITTAGVVTTWTTDPLLVGDVASACPSGLGSAIGANGIALSKDNFFYVTNTDKASVVKIALKADGTPGTASAFAATDCKNLGGADGISVDTDGTLLVASNGINAITRVGVTGKLSILVEKGLFDSPASTWINDTGKGGKNLYITNFGIATLLSGGKPKPGLLKFPL